MNRIKNYCVLAILCLSQALSASTYPNVFSVNDRYTDAELEQQVLNLSQNLDIQYNQEVKTLINIYLSSGRRSSEVLLNRSNYYFPIMENLIEKYDMPDELKYLSVIESGLRPTVKSRVGAVGLWQFMSSTAKMYGLKIVKAHDDRKDVARSTEAAMQYLKDLHNRFGDWSLALAAYNCGPGNVNKAIRRSGGKKSYWEIRKHLPKETRRYLPKMIATMYLMKHFEEYGLSGSSKPFSEHSSFGIAMISDKTTFTGISEMSGLSVKEIKKHNPSYYFNYIPSSNRGNVLILPEVHLLTYLQNIQRMDLLQDVFYLKNTLFTLSVIEIIEEVVEDVRIDVSIESLSQIDLAPISIQNEESTPFASLILTVQNERFKQLFKLRKRQTLAAFIRENNIDLTKTIAEANAQGVVTLSAK